MVHVQEQHVYPFPWATVVHAYQRRFREMPNDNFPSLIKVEFCNFDVKPDKRRIKFATRGFINPDIPRIVRKTMGTPHVIFLSTSVIDYRRSIMTNTVRNVNFKSRVKVMETVTFSVHPDNPNWTVRLQNSDLKLRLPMFSRQAAQTAMAQNAKSSQRARQIDYSYIDQLVQLEHSGQRPLFGFLESMVLKEFGIDEEAAQLAFRSHDESALLIELLDLRSGENRVLHSCKCPGWSTGDTEWEEEEVFGWLDEDEIEVNDSDSEDNISINGSDFLQESIKEEDVEEEECDEKEESFVQEQDDEEDILTPTPNFATTMPMAPTPTLQPELEFHRVLPFCSGCDRHLSSDIFDTELHTFAGPLKLKRKPWVWVRRHCILFGNHLVHYSRATDLGKLPCRGVVHLEEVFVEDPRPGKNVLHLHTSDHGGKGLLFYADKHETKQRWFNLLRMSSNVEAIKDSVLALPPQMSDNTRRVVDVIVIGAGLSGLMCADLLARSGKSVLVLEAANRVGGRTLTASDGYGEPHDLGGQWVGASHQRLRRLGHELGIKLHAQFEHGRHIMHTKKGVFHYTGTIPSCLSVLTLLELQMQGVWRIDALARTVPVEDPFACPAAQKYDSISIKYWIEKTFFTQEAKDVMETVCLMIFGCHSHEVSFLYFLCFVHSAGSISQLVEMKGAAQDSRIVGGAQQLSELLSKRFLDRSERSSLILNTPVRSCRAVSSKSGDSMVAVASKAGMMFSKRVMMAVSPHVCSRVSFQPPLPREREHLCERMFIGCYSKFLVTYTRPFWREAGLSGTSMCPSPSRMFPVSTVFDACCDDSAVLRKSSSVSDGGDVEEEVTSVALVAFVVGQHAVALGSLPEAERRTRIVGHLVKLFGDDAADYTGFLEKEWSKDEFARGCPVGLFPAGSFSHFSRILRQPCGMVHWAGTETASEWTGYMEGALQAAERASDEVLHALDEPVSKATSDERSYFLRHRLSSLSPGSRSRSRSRSRSKSSGSEGTMRMRSRQRMRSLSTHMSPFHPLSVAAEEQLATPWRTPVSYVHTTSAAPFSARAYSFILEHAGVLLLAILVLCVLFTLACMSLGAVMSSSIFSSSCCVASDDV